MFAKLKGKPQNLDLGRMILSLKFSYLKVVDFINFG